MKKAKFNFEDIDLSRWHILTYDELLRVNGGSGNDSDDSDDETVESESEETSDEGAETATESTTGEEGVGEPSADPTSESTSSGTNSESESGGHEIENTVEAVANAEVGDTLTRDDGTQVTITQGDIDWAQEHCDSYGKNGEEAENKEGDLTTKEDEENSDSSLENESNSAKDGENSEKSSGENKDTKTDCASNLPSDYKNSPDFPDYSEERAYINSRLDTPKENSNLSSTNLQVVTEPESKINWNEVKAGVFDIVTGIGVMGVSAAIAPTGAGFVTFPEGLVNFCYGIAELGTGLQGGSLPPSTDLFLEQVTFGLAETGFDK
ncbi:MAG: hypothetical protein IJ530_08750 [Treponema sp.]|uniref:hypothetical protein n=1 Tax=Treponema sp. TaxID=166 RepID=UPI0025CE7629|nr:hypothetical protein [Treponema sp.]MBQ8679841.1 hypothetical protein [Treponema sp.]